MQLFVFHAFKMILKWFWINKLKSIIFLAIHHPRDYPSTFLTARRGQQLTFIQNLIHESIKAENSLHLPVDSVCNLERSANKNFEYSHGQVSIHYIHCNIRYNSVSASDHLSADTKSNRSSTAFPLALIQREDAMSVSGLDMRSCLQFVQELYGQWLTEDTPLGKLERARSASYTFVMRIWRSN